MEEEINYSTVVFKDGRPPPKETKEEPTIYSEVKPKEPPATGTPGGAARCSHDHVWTLCLGILLVLLVGSICGLVSTSLIMNTQKAAVNVLTEESGTLYRRIHKLKAQTANQSGVIDNLNWMMGVILKYNSFPVDEFCPEKKCQPCRTNWILFQEKCYLFYNEDAPWKTWTETRNYCRERTADLVVVDSQEEQEFISNNTEWYYDDIHGFWLGLYETEDQNWLWVDGRNDTLGYWIGEDLGVIGKYALMIPSRPPTASWDPAEEGMRNKFICEGDALMRPD